MADAYQYRGCGATERFDWPKSPATQIRQKGQLVPLLRSEVQPHTPQKEEMVLEEGPSRTTMGKPLESLYPRLGGYHFVNH